MSPDGLQMLWWFIGVWLASGAVLPAFLLLRMVHRRLAASKIGPKGLHVLSGLVGIGIGALILWIVCSFSDSSTAMRDTPAAFVIAQAPLTLAVVAAVRPAGPPLLSGAGQVASIRPRIDDMAQGVRGDASRQTDAAAPPTAPLHRKLAAERGAAHRNTLGPPVRSYVTRSSSRGLWLFAPNEGAN
jgi:hypothetical protein